MDSGDDSLSNDSFSETEDSLSTKETGENVVEDDNIISDIPVQSPTRTQNTRKERRKRSSVWKFMKEVKRLEDGTSKVKCRLCRKVYSHDMKQGTTNLRRHLRERCAQRHKALNILTPIAGAGGDVRRNFDQVAFRDYLAKTIVKHEYPFTYVEHESTRELFTFLNSDVRHISRNTVKADILRMYTKEKLKIQRLIRATPGRVCLTSDMWSSPISDGYMCITAHFIDVEWKLHKKILNFIYMPAPHPGEVILAKMSELMTGTWGIEDKLFSITLDNASANLAFSNSYETRLNLKNALPLRGRYFRIKCCSHILNLIVQDGLKEIDGAVFKIRETVNYLKHSQSRKERFVNCLNNLELKGPRSLRQDVKVRWNSTYLMIERALLFRLAFPELAACDIHYTMCPSDEDWLKLEKISKFLKLFYELTNLFSGVKYPTANLYFQGVWKIQLHLKQAMDSSYTFLKAMAKRMTEKFDKYWSDYSDILSIAMVLDPRYKMKMIEYSYTKLYGSSGQARIDRVRDQLHELFGEYVRVQFVPHSNDPFSSTTTQESGDDSGCDDEMREFDTFQSQVVPEKSQLDVYLEEPCLDWRQPLDVLVYWKSVELRFPELAKMARDVLTIPISTVASEAAFSSGGRILDQYRSSLKPSTVEALICTKDWMFGSHGLKVDDDELEINLLEDSSSTSMSSPATSRASSSKRAKVVTVGTLELVFSILN